MPCWVRSPGLPRLYIVSEFFQDISQTSQYPPGLHLHSHVVCWWVCPVVQIDNQSHEELGRAALEDDTHFSFETPRKSMAISMEIEDSFIQCSINLVEKHAEIIVDGSQHDHVSLDLCRRKFRVFKVRMQHSREMEYSPGPGQHNAVVWISNTELIDIVSLINGELLSVNVLHM